MKQIDGLWNRSPSPSNFGCLQLEAKNFYIVEPKAEPEIWVPVTQSKFVGQAG